MQSIIFIAAVTLTLAVSSSAWSADNEAASDDATPALAAVSKSPVTLEAAPVLSAVPVDVSGFGVPMASDSLDEYRGGFDLVKNDMQLSGTVANNTAVNVLSGGNSIAEGSFANSSGFPMVVQNSGSNVLIQNATIINLQYK